MNRSSRRHATSFLKKSCLSVLVAFALTANANAQEPAEAARYAIPSGNLIQVVNEISRNSGVQIVYDIELLRGKQAAEVRGAMTLESALDKALRGSGLNWTRVSPNTISIQKRPGSPTPPKEKAKTSSGQDPQASEQPEVKEFEEMVVVGSRLGGSPVESALPIKVITREQIDRSGAGSIAQMLSYLPEVPINNDADRAILVQSGIAEGGNTNASTVQMRGLSRGTTLVLINGRRAGDSAGFSSNGFFDLSTIPLSLVERIEVLPAGASAVYGGDALAGVINIVLRKDASGVELRVRHAAADGYGTSQASAMWGGSWSRGSMTVAANWQKSDGLWNDDRALTADQDFRRYGGYDLRLPGGYPANIYSLEGCPVSEWSCGVPLDQRGNLPGLDSPVASVPEGSDGTGLQISDFIGTQGKITKANQRFHLRSEERNFGITVNGTVEIFPHTEAFTDLTYTQRSVPAAQLTVGVWGGEGGKNGFLPADHPLNPFGVPVGVDFQFADTGLFQSYRQQHLRGLLGLRGKAGRFDWELAGWQSRDKAEVEGAQLFDLRKITAAIADPASGFNPLVGDGSAPASLDVLRSLVSTDLLGDMKTRTTGVSGFIRGRLWELPAGNVHALVGMERQSHSIDFETSNPYRLIRVADGKSTNSAVFTEARIPIVSPREGGSIERLAMTGAVRNETSDRFSGSALTKTAGLEARPWESLLLRSTYSTAFRPIITHNALEAPLEMYTSIFDPKFGGYYNTQQITTGGAPADLKPETSTTVTMGLLYRPVQDWSLSLTHWNIKFRDEIRQIGSAAMLENEELYANRIIRDPVTGMVSEIDVRSVNISLKDAAGVDISADGVIESPIGTFYPSVAATYTYRLDQQLTDSSPVRSDLARYNQAGWAPRWKIVPRIGWDYRDMARTMLVGRYVSSYLDPSAFDTGPRAGTYQELGDFWMFDLNLELSLGRVFRNRPILSGTSLNIGATNLFNRLPDFCNSCFVGYDASQYDIVGRTVYAELRVNF